VLLLDGLGFHHTEKFLSDCRDRKIGVIFLVPYSFDQIQPVRGASQSNEVIRIRGHGSL
jgi:hypothetical protein